jgi:hypothetical protein
MDIAFVGTVMIGIAVAISVAILLSVLIRLTVCVCKDKKFMGLALMAFLWFMILGSALLIIGSV